MSIRPRLASRTRAHCALRLALPKHGAPIRSVSRLSYQYGYTSSPLLRRQQRGDSSVSISIGRDIRPLQRRHFSSQAAPAPELLPPWDLVDEEKIPGYKSAHYFPANPGDLLEERYKLEAKIGWGSTSTVWLAQDTQSDASSASKRYVAVKICNTNIPEGDMHELEITEHLCSANPSSRARGVLATALEAHTIESPLGENHVAFVFQPLREPLWLWKDRVAQKGQISIESLPLVKTYLRILLEGLDYMHTQAHVIHTDLKPDNIMVTFESEATIENFVQRQIRNPMARKHVDGRIVYRSHNDFGPVYEGRLGSLIPQITDFGSAQRGDRARKFLYPIQPNEYRAPEVLLGIGWTYSTDMWNFGVLIWELLTGQSLFRQPRTKPYSPGQHLADMTALIGAAPPEIIQRERDLSDTKWSPAVYNPDGKLCHSAREFFGGPFYAEDGAFLHQNLVPHERRLRREAPQCVLEEERVGEFLHFMRRMLCWVPEERATAAELLSDPWLDKGTKNV